MVMNLKGAGGRRTALLLAAFAGGLVLVAMVLTEALDLAPCHLCIFQRVLNLMIALLLIAAASGWLRFALRVLALSMAAAVAAWGMLVAGQQSWMQWFPLATLGCAGDQPGRIELLVEWLGGLFPRLFLATGYCESKELVIIGLSLANWSFVAYAAMFAMSAALIFINVKERK